MTPTAFRGAGPGASGREGDPTRVPGRQAGPQGRGGTGSASISASSKRSSGRVTSTVSSSQLGAALAINDAQVRKDLAFFGQFGYPGIGYRIEELIAALRRILGIDRDWPLALVGLGNLGRALAEIPRVSAAAASTSSPSSTTTRTRSARSTTA